MNGVTKHDVLSQAEIDRLVALHLHKVKLHRQPMCCDGRFCLTGPCPETARMLYNLFPRQSVVKRLLNNLRKGA